MPEFNIYTGDCLDVLKTLADNSIDSICTDPPYGLSDHGEKEIVECMQAWMAGKPYVTSKKGFMGKTWDSFVPGPEVWREAFRVLKPGAYMIVFASTRTDDLMSMACRLAGFRKHPSGSWVFGSGFPKASNLSKAFDKEAGAVREVVGSVVHNRESWRKQEGRADVPSSVCEITAPATKHAKAHEGWFYGLQSMKPAFEPWLMFQKPHEGRMTDNVLKYGTGAINIEACRVATSEELRIGSGGLLSHVRDGKAYPNESTKRTGRAEMGYCGGNTEGEYQTGSDTGRWPANIIHDGSDAVVAMFPDSKGQQGDVKGTEASNTGGEGTNCYGEYGRVPAAKRNDSGSAARFFTQCQHDEDDFETAQRLFYCPKASKADRNSGLNSVVTITFDQLLEREDGSWAQGESKARLLVDTGVFPPKVIGAYGALSSSATEWSTSLFGSEFMDLCRMDTTSTIRMGTGLTTGLTILKCFQSWLTRESIADASCEMVFGGSHAESVEHGSLSILTTSEKMASALGVEHAPSRMQWKISVRGAKSEHPTVKPTTLMRHLVRLITPPGGTCADLFMGSGSTGKAAMLEGFDFIGIEMDASYAEIARARIEHAAKVASGEAPKVASAKPCADRYPVETEAVDEAAQGVLF